MLVLMEVSERMAGMHLASGLSPKTLREARVTAATTTLCRGNPVLWRSAQRGAGGRWGEGCGRDGEGWGMEWMRQVAGWGQGWRWAEAEETWHFSEDKLYIST